MPGNATATATSLPLDPAPAGDLGRLYSFWQARLVDGAPPSVRTIRPEDLRFMLGRINLVDVLPGPIFRYRLVGTTIAAIGAIDMQGQLVSKLKPAFYARLVESHLAAAHARRAPVLHEVVVSRGAVSRRYRRIVLPLQAEPGSGCEGALMTGTAYDEDPVEVLGHPDFIGLASDGVA